MNIDEAIRIAEATTSDILDEEAWAQFGNEVETAIDAALEKMEGVEEQDGEDALGEAIRQSYRDLATKFFLAGAIWRDSQDKDEDEDTPAFTILVDTVEFLASIVKNGSLSVRFVMAEKGSDDA